MSKSQKVVVVHPRQWWESRTLWFNIVSLALVTAGFILDYYYLLDLPQSAVFWAGLVISVGNGALRLITQAPIAGTPAAEPPAPEITTSG